MIDFEKLKLVFPFLQDLSSDDVFDFLKHCSILKLKQGDIFLKQGSRKSNIYFVKEGLIRSYLVNEKGEEITNRLRYENQAMSCYEIDLLNEPSRFNLQALEPTELIVIEVKTMQQIVHGNPKLEPGLRFSSTTF
ncbi:MAG: Crp/Fnr family transcriptional regulator [Bacteroidetes bacterium]|nr:Crp/Fnr family transcriptional regulator [Bacteroidota bacterium]